MNQASTQQLHRRAMDLAIALVNGANPAAPTPEQQMLVRQLLRSAVAIGQRLTLRPGAARRRRHWGVAEMHAAETVYWLERANEQQLLSPSEADGWRHEAQALRAEIANALEHG